MTGLFPTLRSGAPWLAAMALLTVANLLEPAQAWIWMAGLAAGMFLLLEHGRIPRGVQRVSATLGLLSVVLVAFTHVPLDVLRRGVAIGALMSSLISSVTLLARAALRSEGSRAIAAHLLARRVRTRCASFAIACQVFGGLLGLAGVNMLLEMASRSDEGDAERLPVFAAIMRSFSAATLWSPMFSNVSILLALYPGMTWFTLLPLCMALAASTVGVGLAMDFIRLRNHVDADVIAAVSDGDAPVLRAVLPMIAAMCGFLGLVLLVAWLLHVAVAGAIVMLVPVAALAVNTLQARPGPGRLRHALGELKADYQRLPLLAGEVALFMAAGCGGTVIASAIPPEWTHAAAQLVSHSATLACLALMGSVVLLSFMAVHPVLSVVLVATCFPPALVGLPVVPHLLSIMVGWSVSGTVSPFSMLSLMASRYSGASIYAVSVRANHLFALLCMGIAAVALGTVSRGLPFHP
jgi:hypothetical protein